MVLALRPTPEEVEALNRTGSPTVVVGGEVPGWSSVRIDDVETALTAVRHLIGLGHTRIAHLARRTRPRARRPGLLRAR